MSDDKKLAIHEDSAKFLKNLDAHSSDC
jgi:hypothetical protein